MHSPLRTFTSRTDAEPWAEHLRALGLNALVEPYYTAEWIVKVRLDANLIQAIGQRGLPDYSQGVCYGDDACGEEYDDSNGHRMLFTCVGPKLHRGGHYRLPLASEA